MASYQHHDGELEVWQIGQGVELPLEKSCGTPRLSYLDTLGLDTSGLRI